MNKKTYLGILSLIFVAMGIFVSINSKKPQATQISLAQNSPQVLSNQSQSIEARTKLSGCISNGALADQECTPGQIIPDATRDKVCQSGYSSKVRNVPQSEKDAVYQEYNVATRQPGEYEVDHLISLELGGSNDISNLWPEPAEPRPGFHEKDAVENYLHAKVCSGEISLADAQIQIANNWLEVYNKIPK